VIDPLAAFRLDGRVAIVTGASVGLGERFARVLDGAGAQVVVTARRREQLEQLAGELTDGHAVASDLADPGAPAALIDATLQRFGRVDVVVNNAGIACIGPAEDLDVATWRRVLDVNLTGPFLVSRAFGRLMLGAGAGSIVNIASVAGLRGVADRSAYNASKHGLVGLTRTLAAEWGGRGVRVNAVCPGWV
jgi:NAD(P)-dependent dehydrogenase (short-subunit alcohol dehydrogenase family)